MVRRSKRVALVALAVVAVVGFPAMGVGDPGGATSRASASGPFTTEILTTTELLTTTEETSTLTETSTTATSTTTETTTTVDSPTNGTDDLTNETEDVVDEPDDETDSTGELTNSTGNLTDSADSLTNSTNVTDELTDATDSLQAVSTVSAQTHFSVAASSFTGTLEGDVGDPSAVTDAVDSTDGSSPSDRGETTTASDETTAADGDSSGTTASASGASDRSPDRDKRGIPAGGPETAVGVGALTVAALLPQLADALTLAGNAGGVASASSAFFGSTAGRRRTLRSRFDRFWRFVAPLRYSRWDDSDPLDHEVREALYEAIERSPGAYLSQISDRADVALSTARHHLDVLEDERLVTTAKVRGKRRYYPDNAPDVELTAALEDEGTADVLDALARLGASHGGRLADELDRDPSTVSHHLSRLEDAGLVEREREGRAVVNRLAPEARAVLRGGDDGETPAVAD